jgi:hypothetical protein
MGGGLMQLVAYGAQDVYLTGTPQITFFKVVYRRHTNFSIETIEQVFSGQTDFDRQATATILRSGDLAFSMYLQITMSAVTTTNKASGKFAWVRRLGHALLKQMDLEIGGSRIDRQFGTWLDVWYELTHKDNQERGYNKMVGDVAEMTELVSATGTTYKNAYTMYVPLQYWFNRNSGLALPLLALQYHEVRLKIDFNSALSCVCYTGTAPTGLSINECIMLIDYVFLDSEERRRFAQVGHEYLIEQVQNTGEQAVTVTSSSTTTSRYKLDFNHPSKELIWLLKGGNFTYGYTFLQYYHDNSDAGVTNWRDSAAQNLAWGMFQIDAYTASPTINVADYGSYATTSVAARGDTTHTVIIDVVTADSSIAWDSTNSYWTYGGVAKNKIEMLQDVLYMTTPAYNLGDKIDKLILTIAYASGAVYITAISVVTHTLTMRDISIPLNSSLWTDNRVAAGYNNDVVVHQYNNYGVLLDGSGNPIQTAKIQLNGHDRFDERAGDYFNYVQPYQCHTHTPADGLCLYSFALHPEEHQPSGSANLSRIDTTMLNLNFWDPTYTASTLPSLNFFNSYTQLYLYDFSYNVLRVMSGMAGLAYSN